MPRTGYKAVFIREIDELLTIAYIFELLFDHETDSEWNDLILFEFCEQIYPIIQDYRRLAVSFWQLADPQAAPGQLF